MGRPRKNPLTVDKICEGCKKPFTISYRKKHQRFCNKSLAQNTSSVKDKMKQSQLMTYRKNYGVDHPMKTKKVVGKFRQSMTDKYGVTSALKKEEFVTKSFDTKLKKYGDGNYNNFEQIKNTTIEKYGVSNYRLSSDYKTKYTQTCLEKYGVTHSSKSENFKLSHYENMLEKFNTDEDFKNFTPAFSQNEYQGVTHNTKKYPFKCKRCNNIEYHFIGGGFFPLCINCDKQNSSKLQKELYDFLKFSLGQNEIILSNDRSILYPKELDIFIPSLKLAIEFNGLYWHSEIAGNKNKIYHINKLKQCMSKEINLIHIFENEWNNKKEIIKSILTSIIKKSSDKIYARNCIVKEIDIKKCVAFLKNNHLQGKDKSSVKLGLYYNDELVSVMTFCKSRFDKKIEWEMSRYCNKLNTSINGGASKLYSYFIKTYDPNSVVSYNDRRFFNGNVYSNLGFNFIQNTTPNYYYIIDKYKNLANRMNFQKHKIAKLLPDFDSNLTEWENMKNHGFDRIWDCGNGKWVWKTNVSCLQQTPTF